MAATRVRVRPAQRVSVTRADHLSLRSRACWERILLFACGVVAVSPVVFNPWGYEQYQLPKLVLQSLAVIVALLALTVAEGLPMHRVLLPLGAFVVALSVSALNSDAPWTALLGSGSRRFGICSWLLLAGAFVIGMACSSKDRRMPLLRMLLLSSAFISSYGILQRLGLDPLTPVGAGPSLRQASTLGSATYLGGYLAFVVGIGAAALVGRLFSWWWLAPVVALDLVAVLLTQSRGAWVGVVAALVLVVVAAFRRSGRRLAAALALGVVLLVAATALFVPGIGSRAQTLLRPGEGTAGARFELAGMGVDALLEKPALGWGPDMSRPALHNQIGSDFEQRYRDDRIEDRVHNWFLDVAVWSGLIGLALLVWFIVGVGRLGIAQRDDWVVVTVGAGMLAFAGHLFFNFPIPDLDVVVWLFAGTLVKPLSRRTEPVPMRIAGLAAFIAAGLVLLPSIDSLLADRSLRVGLDRENAGDMVGARKAYESARSQAPGSEVYREVLVRFDLRVGDSSAAVIEARAGEDAAPSDPYMAELTSRALVSAALSQAEPSLAAEAEVKLRRLIAGSPYDGSLHLELGTALAAQGHFEQAETEYITASELVPYRSEPFRNLGLLAEQGGDLEAARVYLSQALWIDPRDEVARSGLDRLAAAESSASRTPAPTNP